MPSDQTYETRAQSHLTTEQLHASAVRVMLTQAANVGMKEEWRLREHGKRIRTEAYLQEVLATVPAEKRARLEARIRPYCQIAG